MTNKVLGKIDCLCCGHECDLKESAKLKPYFSCGECSLQCFSRGEPSGQKLIMKLKKIEPVVEVKKPEPVVEINEDDQPAFGWIGGLANG